MSLKENLERIAQLSRQAELGGGEDRLKIGGTGLDVFEREPLETESPSADSRASTNLEVRWAQCSSSSFSEPFLAGIRKTAYIPDPDTCHRLGLTARLNMGHGSSLPGNRNVLKHLEFLITIISKQCTGATSQNSTQIPMVIGRLRLHRPVNPRIATSC